MTNDVIKMPGRDFTLHLLGRPTYVAGPYFLEDIGYDLDRLFQALLDLPWEARTSARRELFLADQPTSYTYGKGPGARTYDSQPMVPAVKTLLSETNLELTMVDGWGPLNGCFLNRYDDQHQALGWHADDFVGMDHDKAVAVVSLGAEREIWWRKKGDKGVVPPENRQLLQHGSLFIMPPGFQFTHDHRIPRSDRAVGTRISLTFRAFKEQP